MMFRAPGPATVKAMQNATEPCAPPKSTPLSRAEWSVVRLVAEGLTNRQIGAQLFVSHRTVDTHVSHALLKLEMSSRVQLAGFALRHAS